jgi:hypothetical protein
MQSDNLGEQLFLDLSRGFWILVLTLQDLISPLLLSKSFILLELTMTSVKGLHVLRKLLFAVTS